MLSELHGNSAVQAVIVEETTPDELGNAICLHNEGKYKDARLAFEVLARQGNQQAQYYLGVAYDYRRGAEPRLEFKQLPVGSKKCDHFFGKFKSEDHRGLCEMHLENARQYEAGENLTEATCHYLIAAQYGSVDAYWHLAFLETRERYDSQRKNDWFREWRKWSGAGEEPLVSSPDDEPHYPVLLYWLIRNPQSERSRLFSRSVDETKLSFEPALNSFWPLEEAPTQEKLAQALFYGHLKYGGHGGFGDLMSTKYLLESAKLGGETAKKYLYWEYWHKKLLPTEYGKTLTLPDVEIELLTACYYLFRGGVDFAKGTELLLELGQRGIGQAYYLLAWNLAHDPKTKAADIDHYLELAVQLGQHVANGYRGWRYHFGIGVEQNNDMARHYYEEAARYGSWERSYLGLIALKAKGISVDLAIPDACPQKDIDELTFLAHTEKNPQAQYALGVMFEKGIYGSQSYRVAGSLYKEANQPDLHQANLRMARLACDDAPRYPAENDWILNVLRKIPPDAGQIYCEARFEIAYLLEYDKTSFKITYLLPFNDRQYAAVLPHHCEYEIALHYYQATHTGNVKFESEVGERIKQFAEKVNPGQRLYDVAMNHKELSLTDEERDRYLTLANKLDHPNAAFEVYKSVKAEEALKRDKNSEQANIQLLLDQVSWLKRAVLLGHDEAKKIIGQISFYAARDLVTYCGKNTEITGYFDDINDCLRIAQAYKFEGAASLVTEWHALESKLLKAELDAEEKADLEAKKKVVKFERASVNSKPQKFAYEDVDSAVKLHDDI